MDYTNKKVIVRGNRSGVYYGTLIRHTGQEVEMADCRNIWSWNGANSLFELSVYGVTEPQHCRITPTVGSVVFNDICEILPLTEKALKCLNRVKPWTV